MWPHVFIDQRSINTWGPIKLCSGRALCLHTHVLPQVGAHLWASTCVCTWVGIHVGPVNDSAVACTRLYLELCSKYRHVLATALSLWVWIIVLLCSFHTWKVWDVHYWCASLFADINVDYWPKGSIINININILVPIPNLNHRFKLGMGNWILDFKSLFAHFGATCCFKMNMLHGYLPIK